MSLTLCIIYFLVSLCQLVSSFFLVAKGSRCRKTYMFLGCQITSILWCFSQVCIYIANDMTQLWISYNIGNLAVCFISTFWLGFSISFAGKKYNKMMLAAFLLSAFHYISVLSNPVHHLYYTEFGTDRIQYGVLFYTNVVLSYMWIFAGIWFIAVSKAQDKNRAYLKKILILTALFPLFLNFLHQVGMVAVTFDVTPLGFCLSYLLVMVATFRYNFLDVNQLAFGQVLEEIQDGIIIFKVDDTCSFQNAVATSFLKGKTIETMEEFYQQLQEEESIELREKGEIIFHRNEQYFHIQKALHYEKNSRAAVSFVIKDVTRYYELMEQSKRISVLEQTLAVEQERSHMVQQIHDTTGHTLTIIQSLLKLAETSIDTEVIKAKDYISQADSYTRQGIREIREYILEVKKEEKYSLITQRILQLADTIKEIPVEVTVVGEDDKKYSYLTETVYTCVRECITNTLKYANATAMQIILKFCKDAVEVHVFDDGKGCKNIHYGNGLQGIYDRVKERQGNLKINSEPGEGFQIVIKLPLNT